MFDLENIKTKTVHIEQQLVQKAVSKEATALSLQQKKLLYVLISNIKADDSDFKRTTISISDYFKLVGIDEGGLDRKHLEKEIQNFADKSFWIGDKVKVLYRWVNIAIIDYKKNEITLELHEMIKEFLLNLDKKSRAIFQLGYVLSFKRKYSPDIYVFSASIKDFMIKKRTMYKMPIEEAFMKFGSGKYTQFSKWREKVLEPSLKEINEKTDLNLCIEFLKTDKKYKTKVTYILFGVTRKVGVTLTKVRVNTLNINQDKSIHDEAAEWADAYVEEYAVNSLGLSPLDYTTEKVLLAIDKHK